MKFFPNEENHEFDHLFKDIKIKFEVDVNPPSGATYDIQYKLLPSPHQIMLYDKESLFAGKIHAILCRNWNSKIKGRDLYDYIFFLANNTTVNIDLIKNKLIDSRYIESNSKFDINVLKQILTDRFKKINYNDAIEDVKPFIKDADSLKHGKTYQRFLSNVKRYLNYSSDDGNHMIDDAIKLSKRKILFQ